MITSRSEIVAAVVVSFLVVLLAFGAVPLLFPRLLTESHLTYLGYIGFVIGMIVAGTVALTLLFAAAFGVAALVDLRNRRALAPHVLSRLELVGDTLHKYARPVEYRGLARPLVGEEALEWTMDLSDVRSATWFECPIMFGEDNLIQFWDRDPGVELTIFGPAPTDPDAVVVRDVDLNLFATAEGSQPVLDYFARKAVAGEFTTNVDLATGDYLTDKLPPFAPGFAMKGRALRQDTPVGTPKFMAEA